MNALMDESNLISHAKQGDLNAFNELILQYQHLLFRIALRVMRDEMLADDMVQDACILAFQKLESFRDGSFRNWFARILVNRCYDELRRLRRQPVQYLESEDQDTDNRSTEDWLADSSLSPEALFEVRVLDVKIQNGLSTLSPKHRAILMFIDMENFSYLEVAEMLSIPVGTVKSSLARARMQMRNAMLAMDAKPLNYKHEKAFTG